MKLLTDFVNRLGRNNLIAIVAIIVLLVLAFFLLQSKGLNQLLKIQPSPTAITTPTPTPKPTTVPGDTIMITFTRPVPMVLTIKKGRYVNFTNFSGAKVEIVGSDSFSKDLNIGLLADNGTSSLILLKNAGSYRYYDKLNPKIAGQIIVTP